jgi:hypothetical protein
MIRAHSPNPAMVFMVATLAAAMTSAILAGDWTGPCGPDSAAACPTCQSTEGMYYCANPSDPPAGYAAGEACHDSLEGFCDNATFSCGTITSCTTGDTSGACATGVACYNPT